MVQDVYALAVGFLGDSVDENLLEIYCKTAVEQLTARLRTGVVPEDCAASFVPAAAWTAVSYYSQATDVDGVASFTAGNFSVTKNSVEYGQLRRQADLLLAPYCKGEMGFVGVAT